MYSELANPFGEQDVKQTCRKFSFVLNENLSGNKSFKHMYWICGFCGLKLTLSERYFFFFFFFVKWILYLPLIQRFYCVGVIYAQRLQKTTFFLRDHSSIHSCFTAQKMKFSIKVSSVNVTKPAVSCGFGHINLRNT